MKCEHVKNRLGAYCAGEIEGDEAADIKFHVSRCAACREEYRKMAMVLSALGDFETVEPRADFQAGVWKRIDEYEARKGAFWLAALAGLLVRNRRLVVTGCVAFAISLLAGIYGLHQMGGGPPVEVATREAAVSDGFVMREIPETLEGASDTVYTHFVIGDRPVHLTSQPNNYVYRPVVRPVSDARPTF
jgi:predicted anti-sigma-YlaC factor YlaD